MILLREIESCKIFMQNLCGGVVSKRGIMGRIKATKAHVFTAWMHYSCRKPSPISPKANALKSGRVILLNTLVSRIFGCRAYSKIAPPIVKSVTVNMVNRLSGGVSHNHTMHTYPTVPMTFARTSFDIRGMLFNICSPSHFRKPFKIFIINKCNITLCQLNFFHNPKTNAGQNVSPVTIRSWSERPTLTPCSALLKISSEYIG